MYLDCTEQEDLSIHHVLILLHLVGSRILSDPLFLYPDQDTHRVILKMNPYLMTHGGGLSLQKEAHDVTCSCCSSVESFNDKFLQ